MPFTFYVGSALKDVAFGPCDFWHKLSLLFFGFERFLSSFFHGLPKL